MTKHTDDVAEIHPEEAGDDWDLPALAPLKGNESLRRLRTRILKTAEELERLRHENAALLERIRELEDRPTLDLERTVVTLDEDPEDVREKVNEFIQIIDEYLEADPD